MVLMTDKLACGRASGVGSTGSVEPRCIRHRHFNMIEVVLALGLVAVGLVSIMALFPVGVNASRDGMAEGYAATAADQILHHFAYLAREDWDLHMLPTALGGGGRIEVDANGPDDVDRADFTPTGTALDAPTNTLYQASATDWKHYKIIRSTTLQATTVTDFEAIAVLWRSQIQLPISNGQVLWPYGGKLNVEISWPAGVPVTQRSKSYYCVELFNH